jgi:ketosteroid isomerase-like protein
MSGLEGIADRFEIEALRGEFTDAVMTHDYDRLASLFTQDGAVVMPHINANARTRDEIRAGVERLQSLWECFVQTTHPGTIYVDGDTATGRAYVSELMYGPRGSHRNYAVYHDRYERTSDGWKFAERIYEVRYVDTTPVAGSLPDAA